MIVPGGEAAKNDPSYVSRLHEQMLELRLDRHSAVIAFGATILVLIVATPAAYYIARFRFPGRLVFLLLVLCTQMLQPTVLAVGLFQEFKGWQGYAVWGALILINAAFNLRRQSWRSIGVRDLLSIARAVLLFAMISSAAAFFLGGSYRIPRSIPLIDALLTIVLWGGVRLFARIFSEERVRSSGKGKTRRVLIAGAGADRSGRKSFSFRGLARPRRRTSGPTVAHAVPPSRASAA